ncbi:TPA: hypothetical protein N2D99_002253 [Clostridium botulinum]|nr:hypothetical protein [Clostridium botulinum]
MENTHDIEIKFKTRGDDIEMLNQAISLVPIENEALAGYLCYLKFSIVEQLGQAGVDLLKEDYPIGHPKGMTWDEVLKEYH